MRTPPFAARHAKTQRRWKLSKLSLIPALIMFFGLSVLTWPYMAAWINQLAFSGVTANYSQAITEAQPEARIQLERAHKYNDALKVGAIYEANTNIPTAQGSTEGDDTIDGIDYWHQLLANQSGLMARLKIPKINLDLPVYHGTSDYTLLHGLGHLRGTSLPVGGAGTRALITGHRGLAEAEMFTRLDELDKGDTFTVEVFGEVLTYRIYEKIVVAPDEKKAFQAIPGRDLVTLVTCTPLGINTHRILITGERVIPTPAKDLADAGKAPTVPGFPWWAVWYTTGIEIIVLYIYWSGLPPKARKRQDPEKMSPKQRARYEKQEAKRAELRGKQEAKRAAKAERKSRRAGP